MKYFVLILLLLAADYSPAFDTREFENDADRDRYQKLITELRCPVCQNQNLADSGSGLAIDLRQQIFQQIESGKSDHDIVDFMLQRYGDFILYRPRLTSGTLALWFGPVLVLVTGFIILIVISRRNSTVTLSESEEQFLQDIMNEPPAGRGRDS